MPRRRDDDAVWASLVSRFWQRIERPSGDDAACWSWTGQVDGFGYGILNRRFGSRWRMCAAHRISWEIVSGPVPDGMCVLHRCDNPPCCNPAHLFLGTRLDNARDMAAKGRAHKHGMPADVQPRGSRHGQAKLSEEQVVGIKAAFASGETTIRALARSLGVGASTISRIVNGKGWTHVHCV